MTNFAPYFIDMRLLSPKISFLMMACALAIGLICISCKKEQPPKDILSKEQLTEIMMEFYLGEAKLSGLPIQYDSSSKLFIPFEESVLKKYGVADTTLYKSYQYYFDHPIELEKIYEIVIDSLSLRERKAGGMLPPQEQ